MFYKVRSFADWFHDFQIENGVVENKIGLSARHCTSGILHCVVPEDTYIHNPPNENVIWFGISNDLSWEWGVYSWHYFLEPHVHVASKSFETLNYFVQGENCFQG